MGGNSYSNQRLALLAPRIILCGGIVIHAMFGSMLSSGYSQAAETLSLQTNARGIEAQLPDILSEADRTRYRKIFAIQERGDWRGADRLIKKLDKKLLLGHVMAMT